MGVFVNSKTTIKMNKEYIVLCRNKNAAGSLCKRLAECLHDQNIKCRVLVNINVIDIMGADASVRFIPQGTMVDVLRGRHNVRLYFAYHVERYLEKYESEKRSKELYTAMLEMWE